jgi:hypothetical protein
VFANLKSPRMGRGIQRFAKNAKMGSPRSLTARYFIGAARP